MLRGAVVVDLSAMWAGPLCGRLLAEGGARVVKVESCTRPDGARADARFFNRLHTGQRLVTIDFGSADGRAELAGLLTGADIVIEASRPRALAQLGLAPDQLDRPDGQVWLSITGYGRDDPGKVAFGDDAAVAGGLVGRDDDGDPVFCADAIADPLTGVCGAYAVAMAYANGGGSLIDLSMRNVAATFAAAPPECPGEHPVTQDGFGWKVACSQLGRSQWVLPPC
jgi:crotonobetainyl-CoA:carnitine CoA-transferase CaiB-like acyl-CoA transferase